TSLRMAAYQLHFLTRVPAFAVADDSVELVKRARKKSAAGLVNAVVRKLARLPEPLPDISATQDAPELAFAAAHPEWIVSRWVERYGLEAAKKICAYDQAEPETTVRVLSAGAEPELAAASVTLAPGHLLAGAHRLISGNISRLNSVAVQIQDEG